MKRAGAACIAIVATLFGATLDAQRLAPAVLTSTSSSTASTAFHRHPPSSPTLPKAKDYTLEGAAIGGIAMGLFGAYFAAGMCGMDDHEGSCSGAALTGLLGGVTVGATLGGIIGSGKKKAPRYPSDSALLGPLPAERPPVRVRPDSALLPRARSGGGNGIALGAVLVGGGVALLSTLGCSLDQSGGHENCAWNAVKRGAVGAVAGGVAAALISGLFARDPRAP